MSSAGQVCICIPAYNEELTLFEVVQSIVDDKRLHEAYDVRIVIADNESTDFTPSLIKQLQDLCGNNIVHSIRVPQGAGITGVYASAFSYALKMFKDAKYFIGMDAGMSHDPRMIVYFLHKLQYSDCVFGSRSLGSNNSPVTRKVLSTVGTFVSNLLLGMDYTDATSGYSAFTREALQKIDFKKFESKWYFYDTELRYQCKENNLYTMEQPIHYRSTSSHLKKRHVLEAARALTHLFLKRVDAILKDKKDDSEFIFP